MALAVEAFAEDCARAAIVVSQREAPSPNCAATLIDRTTWHTYGAVALRWTGDHFEQNVTHPPGHKRPWTQRLAVATVDAAQPQSPRSDATPRSEDLDAED